MSNRMEEQENQFELHAGSDHANIGSLDTKLTHVKQLASRSSFKLAKKDINEFSTLIASVETSLGGLRQEVDAVKQLGNSRSNSSPQQQLSFPGQQQQITFQGELLDPLHGFSARLSTPVRRSALAASEASASRRSSLGLRLQQQAWDGSSLMGAPSEGYGAMEERIYAGIASALKAAAAQRTPTKTASQVGGRPAASSATGMGGSPLQQHLSGELGGAAVVSAEHLGVPTASSVAAAVQELAAATAADQQGQQLLQQIHQLEREVEAMKQTVAAHTQQSSSHQQDSKQQLQEQQQRTAALATELQELKQRQREQQQQRPATPVMEELLADLREQAQQQIADIGRQQEERVSLLLDDLREELLDRLDGLQLRLQAVEEEQERFGDRQQQQRKDIQRLQAASQQLEQEQQQSRRTTEGDSGVCAQAPAAAPLNAASALMQRTVSGRQRVAAAPLSAAAVAEHAHTDGGVVCNLPQGFSLPEMGCMLPSSFSEPDQAQSSRDLATYQPTPSSLGKPSSGQQQPRDVRASDTMPADGEHSGASVSQLLSESRSSRAQLFSAAGLVDRVCALEEQQQETEELVARLEVLEELQQQQAEELAARLQALEDLSAGAVPLDAMTCGAVEARLSVLEDDNSEHKQQLQEAQAQLAKLCGELEAVQQQLGSREALPKLHAGQQLQCTDPAADTDLAARVASLEAQQQELQEQQQRLLETQQQLSSGDGSYGSFDSQPSSVKDRIQQFEEQLNAAIRRFAPGHMGSRPQSEGGLAAVAAELSPFSRKNPGRESSLRELLANLQADVDQLMSKAPGSAGDRDNDESCCTDGSAGSAVGEDAGFVLAGQLQQQLAKLTQNCAELGEAVLQLDVQMQQVEERVKQQRQQTLTAAQSATAATYISKEAAHEIERVVLQVQQLSAAVKALGSSKDPVAAAAGGQATADASARDEESAAAPAAEDSSGWAAQLQQLQNSVEELTQQVEQSTLQLEQQAALQQEHAVAVKRLEQQLAEHQQQAEAVSAAHQAQLASLEGLQGQQQEQQGATAAQQAQQLMQVSKQVEEQQSVCADLQQQLQQQATLLQQCQATSEAVLQLQQKVQRHDEQLGDTFVPGALQQQQQQLAQQEQQLQELSAVTTNLQQQLQDHQLVQMEQQLRELSATSADLQQQLQGHAQVEQQLQELSATSSDLQQQLQQRSDVEQQLQELSAATADLQQQLQQHSLLEQQLQQLSATSADLLQRQEQQAAATASVAAMQDQLQQVQGQLSQQGAQADEQSGLLFSLRVDLQNGLQELGERLQGVEGLRGDMDIWEDSRKAAAARTEAAAAEALDKVEALMASVADQQAQQAEAATGAGADLHTQLQQVQQQLQQVPQRLDAMEQQLLDSKQQLAAQAQDAHAASGEELKRLQMQLVTSCDQVQQKLEQQLARVEEELQAQLLSHNSQLQQHDAQLQQLAQSTEQLQEQAVQAGLELGEVNSMVQSLQEGLQAQVEQGQRLQDDRQQQQGVQEQLQQLSQGLSAVQGGCIEQAGNIQAHASKLRGLQDQLQALQQQLSASNEGQSVSQLEAAQMQQQLQEHLDVLKADAAQHQQQQTDHVTQALQPLQEQQAALQQRQQHQQAAAAALEQQVSCQEALLQEARQQLSAMQQQEGGLEKLEGVSAQQAQLLQQLQAELAGLQQQQRDIAAQAEQQQQLEQELERGTQQSLTEQLHEVQSQLLQHSGSLSDLQQQLAELSCKTQQLASMEAAQRLQGEVQAVQAQLAELSSQALQHASVEAMQQLQGEVRAVQSQLAEVSSQALQHASGEAVQKLLGEVQAVQAQCAELSSQALQHASVDTVQQLQGEVQVVQAQLAELSSQALQHASGEAVQQLQGEVQAVQAQLAELTSQALQHASGEAVHQLQGEVQALQAQCGELSSQALQHAPLEAVQQLQVQLQQQREQVQQKLEQHTKTVQQDVRQLRQLMSESRDQQQAVNTTAATQAQQVQQHGEQLTTLQQHYQQQQAVLADLQQSQGQASAKLLELTQQQGQHGAQLLNVQERTQQGAEKLQSLLQLQDKQQQVLRDVSKQQDQGVQQLQQLQTSMDVLSSSVVQATDGVTAAVADAARAEQQVRELRQDLEEALGFMAPFLSPSASSLTSPGGTPFVSPHRRAYEGFSAANHGQSPFTPHAGGIGPMHAVSAGIPGYSVTIDIGTQLPGRPVAMMPGSQAAVQSALHALQQQQQGLLEITSAAASRRVSAQDSQSTLQAAVHTPLSAGLWRPEPHQVAPEAAAAAAAGSSSAFSTPVGALSRFDAPAALAAPGSSGSRLVRCASLDSPSFRAAVVAGIGYGPSPPSQPSTGARPFRAQLGGMAAAAAAGGAEGFRAEDDLGLYVTPIRATGSIARAGGSSAGRLLRTGSLGSPSFVAAATAGQFYEPTPVQSGGGAASSSRFALSINASDAELRLFDALGASVGGEASDAAAAAAGAFTAAGGMAQQELLPGNDSDDSPEQHQQRRLPGGVMAASALMRSAARLSGASPSTVDGIGSQRSSMVWSARDSAVFDNSLYNTPRKRRKGRAAGAAATPGSKDAAAAGLAGSDDDASDASSDSGGSHSGLVSLTDSLTALQLRRLAGAAGAVGSGGALPEFGESPPITPTGASVAALDGSSPATTATPVSVYRNLMYEDSDRSLHRAAVPGARASKSLKLEQGARLVGASVPAPALSPEAQQGYAGAADADAGGFSTPAAASMPPGLSAESSAADAAAAAMAAGRSLSPAEAIATVRSLATSATPPSLGSWQKKRQQKQQQEQQQHPALPEEVPAAASSCDFAAGPAAADSPVMVPHGVSAQQQESSGVPARHAGGSRAASPILAALFSSSSEGEDEEERAEDVTGPQQQAQLPPPHPQRQQQQEQPQTVLSAELLQQHTLQQQQRFNDMNLPWLQQQQLEAASLQPVPAAAAAALAPADVSRTPTAQGSAELPVLSPMLSELLSLGADVIDLAGSEADSDLLAMTPERTCSKTVPATGTLAQAGALEGLNRQLAFDEDCDNADGGAGHGGAAAAAAAHGSSSSAGDGGHQGTAPGGVQQQAKQAEQQQEVTRECTISLSGMMQRVQQVQPPAATAVSAEINAGGAGAGAGAGVPSSSSSKQQDEEDEEPVLRLRGGGGFEPHHDGDLSVGDVAEWGIGREESFDLAECGSSDDGWGGSCVDGYSDEAWEFVAPPGVANPAPPAGAAAQSSSSSGGRGAVGLQRSAAAAAAAPGGRGAASSSNACGGSGAKAAAVQRPPVPQGWLRAVPPGWAVGSAPPDAYRVALRTSSKTGSGTKTRATLLLTAGQGSSSAVLAEHKLGGGRKRCSYNPGSTVQDWLLLHSTASRPNCTGGAATARSAATAAAGVSRVAVRHDAAGFSGAWLLDSVVVQHLSSGDWWQFDNRGSWLKGTQQAKAVAARDVGEGIERGAEAAAAGAGSQGGTAASSVVSKPPPAAARQLHLSASGVAANCPLDDMPATSSADGSAGGTMSLASSSSMQRCEAAAGADAASRLASVTAGGKSGGQQAAAGARAEAAAEDGASTNSKGDSSVIAAGGFVPLDDVELKLRGSPRRSNSRSRSCSPSPTHKARQQPQGRPSGEQGSAAVGSQAAVPMPNEASSLRSIAAVVSRAAAPAVQQVTAAAWDVLGSRRSSAGEVRVPGSRRVSGSIAPSKLVPLVTVRSSSGGGSEDGILVRADRPSSEAMAGPSGVADRDGSGDEAGCDPSGLTLNCRASRTLTHSSDGTPARLVRCSSSYLGRSSSERARHAQEQQQRGVHFLEWAEQLEFDAAAAQGRRSGVGSSGTSSSSSIQSFTEEQLLEAQGGWEFVRPPEASSSYTTLITSQGESPAGIRAGVQAAGPAADSAAAVDPGAFGAAGVGGDDLQEVSLVVAKPAGPGKAGGGGGSEYQLRTYTADKIGAALPSGQHVCLEVLGSTGALLTTQLPRPKGSFLRGSCESFSLSSAAGDIGRIEAVKVWHEPAGAALGGGWCLQQVDVEAVFRGVTYVFSKPGQECWVGRGLERAVVLTQPRKARLDDAAALAAEAAELQRQLDNNAALEEGDKTVLTDRLQKLQLRLTTARA